MMSISSLFYIIMAQWFFGKTLKLVPLSGFVPGLDLFKFLALPIVVGIVFQLGSRGAALPRDAARGDRQGLRPHRALQGPGRARRAVRPRAAQRLAADPDARRRAAAATRSSARSCSSRSSASRASAPTSSTRSPAQDFAIVHTMVFLGSLLYILGLPRDRHRLHVRRSAGPARLTTAHRCPSSSSSGPTSCCGSSSRRSSPTWSRPAQRRTCARPGAMCCTTRRRCRPPSCWRSSSRLALLDSIHFRPRLAAAPGAARRCLGRRMRRARCRCSTCCCRHAIEAREKTYSVPLAYWSFQRETAVVDGKRSARASAPGPSAARICRTRSADWKPDLRTRSLPGIAGGLAFAALLASPWPRCAGARRGGWRDVARATWLRGDTEVPWRAMLLTASAIAMFIGWLVAIWPALPPVRHRPHRQRRAVPGAEEHPHGGRDRLAVDDRHAAARDRARHAGGLLQGLGRRRRSSTSTRCCRRSRRSCWSPRSCC